MGERSLDDAEAVDEGDNSDCWLLARALPVAAFVPPDADGAAGGYAQLADSVAADAAMLWWINGPN